MRLYTHSNQLFQRSKEKTCRLAHLRFRGSVQIGTTTQRLEMYKVPEYASRFLKQDKHEKLNMEKFDIYTKNVNNST